FYFFFQAEDGIRDRNVTGVQTCALPISEGFSNDYSLMYHYYPPTQIIKTEPQLSVAPAIAEEKMLKHRSFEGFKIKPEKDFLQRDRKSTRLNSSHVSISYAVFCLKKKIK